MENGIVTTEECPQCAHIFARYIDYLPNQRAVHKAQDTCPTCARPVTTILVRHPEQTSL